MNKIKKAIGYVRKNQLLTIENQKDLIYKYCRDNGYSVVKWLVDDDVFNDSKNDFLNDEILYGKIKIGTFDALIVSNSNLIAKEQNEFLYFVFILKKKKTELICLENNFNEIYENYKDLLDFFVKKDIENLAKRTSKARNEKALDGGYSGGRCPYGYTVKNGALEINEKEARVIKLIFSMYDERKSMLEITKYLNNEGIRSKTGKEISYTAIWNIIQRRKFYEGYIDYGNRESWVKGIHEPILK